MASFLESKKFTGDLEGGFWDDPSAGWTYAGITRKYYPSWAGFKRLEQLRRIKFGNNPIPRYTVFNDTTLNNLVSQFYRNNHWQKINGEYVANQTLANLMWDFYVHKENDAIRVINETGRQLDPGVEIKSTSISIELIKLINQQPVEYYAMLRRARIKYYMTKPGFSKKMREAFVWRVNRFPQSISNVKRFFSFF